MAVDKSIIGDIFNASQKNALSFFVGAGVSKTCNMPLWSDLIDDISKELGLPQKGNNYSSDEYLSIPQKFYYYLGCDKKAYYDFLTPRLKKDDAEPNNIHHYMLSLNPNCFITTNFDNLIELAAIYNCKTYKLVTKDSDVSKIYGDNFILKVHGDIDTQNIVLKEEDYLSYSDDFKLIETILKSIFSTNTVVFIGYRLNDYNIKIILNWVKSSLKSGFREPIFIYTETEILTKTDIIYHTSRGLKILDYHEHISAGIDASKVDYFDRYMCVLREMKNDTIKNLEKMSKEECFDVLYELLVPLNRLRALRTTDINKALQGYVFVNELGYIHDLHACSIFDYYNELYQKDNVPVKYKRKYNIICSVLKKARIVCHLSNDNKKSVQYRFSGDIGDKFCIEFNYKAMENFIKSSSNDIWSLYRKAYYLAKLNRFNESFELYKECARQAFSKQNHILYYFAQRNVLSIYKALKHANMSLIYYSTYTLEELDKVTLDSFHEERFFDTMPTEFQKAYPMLADVGTANYLFNNFYNTVLGANKLRHSFDTDSIEFGISSFQTVFGHVYNNLHFSLGNCLYVDEFSEFKNSIKEQFKSLVYAYSYQDCERIIKSFDFEMHRQKIWFDENDFFCLIQYFSGKEIDDLFSNCELKKIQFDNMNLVEKAIRNLFSYYDIIARKIGITTIEIYPYQQKLKTCLCLMRYFKVSIKTIEFVTAIVLKYEFREIDISDKILFIDSQVAVNKRNSKLLQDIILVKLLEYIEQEKHCLIKGEKFEQLARRNLFYYSLANYISKNNKEAVEKLSLAIDNILLSCPNFKLSHILNFYHKVNTNTKDKILKKVFEAFHKKFETELAEFLVSNRIKLNEQDLKSIKENAKSQFVEITESNKIIHRYPKPDPSSLIVNVGYWCFIGYLNKKYFSELYGICDEFDFLYDPNNFDYSLFNISWLFGLYKHNHRVIRKIEDAKLGVKNAIIKRLASGNLHKYDEKYLLNLLVEFYS